MDFWKKSEERRARLKMSRAEMARRCHISESTVFKGLQKKTRPSGIVAKQIDLVLSLEERLQGVESAA